MLDKLKELIDTGKLHELISNKDIWNSLDVDYHPPKVERMRLSPFFICFSTG